MSQTSDVKQIVEKVVSQVLQSHVSQLREELVRRVLDEVQPQLGGVAASSNGSSATLLRAISAIHAGGNQREILRSLLDSTVHFSSRSALFIVKAGTGTAWQARGFANNDEVKDFSLDLGTGMAARTMQSRTASSGNAGEFDSGFISRFHAPSDNRVLLLPLVLKDKVAALIYADAGNQTGGHLDASSLELLLLTTSTWLEVVSVRKQTYKDAPEAVATEAHEAAPTTTAAAHSDPFAAHPPLAMAAAAGADSSVQPAPIPAAVTEAPAATHGDLSAEDADVHKKAQRFARLLVDEIKLYNQAKVTDGRNHKDLYDRLKDDIEKSRATFGKRYGTTVAAAANYFDQELVHNLADDDPAVMGVNFRR